MIQTRIDAGVRVILSDENAFEGTNRVECKFRDERYGAFYFGKVYLDGVYESYGQPLWENGGVKDTYITPDSGIRGLRVAFNNNVDCITDDNGVHLWFKGSNEPRSLFSYDRFKGVYRMDNIPMWENSD